MNVTFDELYMVIGVKVIEIAKLQTRLDALAAEAENLRALVDELKKPREGCGGVMAGAV